MKERVDVIWIVAIADHLIPSAWSMLMSFLTLHSKSKTQANAQTKRRTLRVSPAFDASFDGT